MKLPSPFTLTVRASTDYVKVFPEQLPESDCLAGLSVIRECRVWVDR